jgi:hypothetical protein
LTWRASLRHGPRAGFVSPGRRRPNRIPRFHLQTQYRQTEQSVLSHASPNYFFPTVSITSQPHPQDPPNPPASLKSKGRCSLAGSAAAGVPCGTGRDRSGSCLEQRPEIGFVPPSPPRTELASFCIPSRGPNVGFVPQPRPCRCGRGSGSGPGLALFRKKPGSRRDGRSATRCLRCAC